MQQYIVLAEQLMGSKHFYMHGYYVLTWNLEFRGVSTKVSANICQHLQSFLIMIIIVGKRFNKL
jgi:hypothetical protein